MTSPSNEQKIQTKTQVTLNLKEHPKWEFGLRLCPVIRACSSLYSSQWVTWSQTDGSHSRMQKPSRLPMHQFRSRDAHLAVCSPLGFVFMCSTVANSSRDNSGDVIQLVTQTYQSRRYRLFKEGLGIQFKYLFRQGQLRIECGRSHSPTVEQQKALYAITATVSARLAVPHKVNQIPWK